MAINRVLQSSVQNGLPKFDGVWNGISAVGSMEPISAITLSANQANIEFNNIPSTYTHLQLRGFLRGTYVDAIQRVSLNLTFNNTASNSTSYADHDLNGDGSVVTATGYASTSQINIPFIPNASATSNIFGVLIIDILDYANTNKYKVARSICGHDRNGAGYISLNSGLYMSTNAISSIKIEPYYDQLATNSTLSLYGIK